MNIEILIQPPSGCGLLDLNHVTHLFDNNNLIFIFASKKPLAIKRKRR